MLTQEHKTFVVQRFAVYDTPQQIVRLVKEHFGIDVARQTIHYYNVDMNPSLPAYWKEIHAQTRAAFLDGLQKIPATNQAYRLKTLQKLIDDQLNNGNRVNHIAVAGLLEQAAKEVGGMFTNRRELTGAEGKPLMDPTEMARSLVKELVEKDGLTLEKAVAFATKEYKVPEDVLISEAEN